MAALARRGWAPPAESRFRSFLPPSLLSFSSLCRSAFYHSVSSYKDAYTLFLGICKEMCWEDRLSDTRLVWVRSVLKKCVLVWRQCEGEEKGCVYAFLSDCSTSSAGSPLSLCAELSAARWALSLSLSELARSQPMRCVKAYWYFTFTCMRPGLDLLSSTLSLTGFIKLYI